MSLLPARATHTIWRGATFHKRITILTGMVGSDPRDLTGYTGLLEIRDAPQGTVLFTLSTGNNRITMGGSSGILELIISATDTAGLTWNSGVYDLTITAPGPSGETDPILFGTFDVRGV